MRMDTRKKNGVNNMPIYREGLTNKYNPEYKVWQAMIRRCHNPDDKSYEDYGLDGITVCSRWKSTNGFKNFLNDMGVRPSGKSGDIHLDREDADYGYHPCNCQWVTRRENILNSSHTRWVTFKGKTLCLKDWARELNINYNTLFNRLNAYGWSIEEAFTIPIRGKRKNK